MEKPRAVNSSLVDTVKKWRRGFDDNSRLIRLSDFACHAMSLAEAIVGHEEALAKASDMAISCKKGCGACCRQVIPISPPEAFLLSERIINARTSEGSILEERFHESLERLKTNGMEEAPLIDQAGKYFQLGLPCPFLEEESCSIHLHRPLTCREQLVVSPADFCGEFPSYGIEPLSIPLSIQEAFGEVAGELLGMGRIMIPMIRLQAWVEAHREVGEKVWETGFLADKLVERVFTRIPHIKK